MEAVWTIVPTLICIFIAYEGIRIFRDIKRIPKDALTINAVGSQWKWDFTYENGKQTTGEFVVPVGKPIKVVLTSTDVLHSFFIPVMRVKSDAVKGQYTYVSFKAIKTGEYHTFCTEYCGKDHSAMLAKLRVVSEADYERWVNDKSEKVVSPIERGRILYAKKACNSCHSLDGTRGVGPSWLKLFGKTEKFTDGTSAIVDEQYLRESILKPNVKIVESYPPNAMPAFEGQLSEEDLAGLVTFIRSLDGSAPVAAVKPAAAPAVDLTKLSPEERGKYYYENGKGAGPSCKSCHSLDGSPLVGPSYKGIYGRAAKFTDGTDYTVTDDYIKESILEPNAHIVQGFAPGMIAYKGILTDDDIKDITAFLKTVK